MMMTPCCTHPLVSALIKCMSHFHKQTQLVLSEWLLVQQGEVAEPTGLSKLASSVVNNLKEHLLEFLPHPVPEFSSVSR